MKAIEKVKKRDDEVYTQLGKWNYLRGEAFAKSHQITKLNSQQRNITIILDPIINRLGRSLDKTFQDNIRTQRCTYQLIRYMNYRRNCETESQIGFVDVEH